MNSNLEGQQQNKLASCGPQIIESNTSLNETDALPHNLTKFSEMNNSIQVLKPADIIKGEHQMIQELNEKDCQDSFPFMDMLNDGRNEMTSVMSSLN